MLKVPPPTRVPLGVLQVGGQRFELILSPEWARYFEALNSQVMANSENLARSAAYAATIGEAQDASDPLLALPGPPGLQGDPGLPLFLLQDDPGEPTLVLGPTGPTGRQGDAGLALFLLHDDPVEQSAMIPPCVDGVYVPLKSKDAPDGVPALTQLKLNLLNAAGTITSWITSAATAARTWTMPNKDGTVAVLEDFAAPPAIGGTTAAAGTFTTVTAKSTAQYGILHQGGLTAGGKIYAGSLVGAAAAPHQSGGFGYVYDSTAPLASFFHLTPWGEAEGSKFKVDAVGNLTAGAGFGCNGKPAQPAAASGGTLAGVISALVANGILSS